MAVPMGHGRIVWNERARRDRGGRAADAYFTDAFQKRFM